jgi:hypothetical protein
VDPQPVNSKAILITVVVDPSLMAALTWWFCAVSSPLPSLPSPVEAWFPTGGPGDWPTKGKHRSFLLCSVQRGPSGKSAMPSPSFAFWYFLACSSAGPRPPGGGSLWGGGLGPLYYYALDKLVRACASSPKISWGGHRPSQTTPDLKFQVPSYDKRQKTQVGIKK